MEYNCRPIYKYIAFLFITILLLIHQEILDNPLDVVLLSLFMTFVCVIMDYTFIKKHPDATIDPTINKYETDYIDELEPFDRNDKPRNTIVDATIRTDDMHVPSIDDVDSM